mgnify:CR=1 FL=1
MSGKSGISTDKMSLLSLSPAKRAFGRTKGRYSLPDMGSCRVSVSAVTYCRHRTHMCEVADNILVQSELKVLPVPIYGQVKLSSACLSACYLPPLESVYIASALQLPRPHGLPPHLRHYYPPPASACARHPFYMTTSAAATAACGPGAKMSLAYATGPFSVPHGPARPSRTTGGQILYGALQPPPHDRPWLIAEVRPHQV